MIKIAVLISGSGSNLQNLAEKCTTELKGKCEIAIVISNKEGVKGLEIAQNFGIKNTVLKDTSPKISILTKNIANYNDFAQLKIKADIAFAEICKPLQEKGYETNLATILEAALEKLPFLSNFPEEDFKENVLTDIFFEAFTLGLPLISKHKEEEILAEIDDLLYGYMEEIKVIASLFTIIQKEPSFVKFLAREKYDEVLHNFMKQEGVHYIFLAGFMRILTPTFISKWEGKIFNIHPSLLPSFGGAKAVKEALQYGVKVTGCTVHHVSAGVDAGKIIAQQAVEVKKEDTEETLHERIKNAEKELYPKVLEQLIDGKL